MWQKLNSFLGKRLFPTGKLSDAFDYIKSEFETKLININALLIRDEYKVWIYKHYVIPSIRSLLTVNTISQLNLNWKKYFEKCRFLSPPMILHQKCQPNRSSRLAGYRQHIRMSCIDEIDDLTNWILSFDYQKVVLDVIFKGWGGGFDSIE